MIIILKKNIIKQVVETSSFVIIYRIKDYRNRIDQLFNVYNRKYVLQLLIRNIHTHTHTHTHTHIQTHTHTHTYNYIYSNFYS